MVHFLGLGLQSYGLPCSSPVRSGVLWAYGGLRGSVEGPRGPRAGRALRTQKSLFSTTPLPCDSKQLTSPLWASMSSCKAGRVNIHLKGLFWG